MNDQLYPEPTAAQSAANSGVFLVVSLALLALMVVLLVANWKLFTKAGKPGWASIVPFYNIIVMLQMVARPWWWLLLMFIPLVGFIVQIMLYLELAKAFGKDTVFAVLGLILFPYVGIPILAFGPATYTPPVSDGPATPPAPAATPTPTPTPTA